MNVIDLFAGAGGLSEGFRNAGFDVLAHVEMDKSACLTLKTREAYYYLKKNNMLDIYKDYLLENINRDELYEFIPSDYLDSVINSEINESTIQAIFNRIDGLVGNKNIDMIIGGPPCQAYSLVGRSRDVNKMKNDSRNYLYRYYIKFLERYNPNFFIFENVQGILSAQEGKIFNNIRDEMREAGYEIDYRIINASDFGVVQSRKRVIIIGWRKEIDFEFPEFEMNESNHTIKQLFCDLPQIKSGVNLQPGRKYVEEKHCSVEGIREEGWDILTQHISRTNRDIDLDIYQYCVHVWNTENRKVKYNELPERLITHKNTNTFLDRFKVVPYDDVSHTIVAHICKDGHYYIHPDINQNRSITVREAARIQGFPDDYYFEESRTAAFKQIGNAVPPKMAKIIADKLLNF